MLEVLLQLCKKCKSLHIFTYCILWHGKELYWYVIWFMSQISISGKLKNAILQLWIPAKGRPVVSICFNQFLILIADILHQQRYYLCSDSVCFFTFSRAESCLLLSVFHVNNRLSWADRTSVLLRTHARIGKSRKENNFKKRQKL